MNLSINTAIDEKLFFRAYYRPLFQCFTISYNITACRVSFLSKSQICLSSSKSVRRAICSFSQFLLQSDGDTKGFSSSCSESLPNFCLSGYDSPQEFQKLKQFRICFPLRSFFNCSCYLLRSTFLTGSRYTISVKQQ